MHNHNTSKDCQYHKETRRMSEATEERQSPIIESCSPRRNSRSNLRKRCICKNRECKGVSAAFRVLADIRGCYVVLPSSPETVSCQYLAMHHLHPEVGIHCPEIKKGIFKFPPKETLQELTKVLGLGGEAQEQQPASSVFIPFYNQAKADLKKLIEEHEINFDEVIVLAKGRRNPLTENTQRKQQKDGIDTGFDTGHIEKPHENFPSSNKNTSGTIGPASAAEQGNGLITSDAVAIGNALKAEEDAALETSFDYSIESNEHRHCSSVEAPLPPQSPPVSPIVNCHTNKVRDMENIKTLSDEYYESEITVHAEELCPDEEEIRPHHLSMSKDDSLATIDDENTASTRYITGLDDSGQEGPEMQTCMEGTKHVKISGRQDNGPWLDETSLKRDDTASTISNSGSDEEILEKEISLSIYTESAHDSSSKSIEQLRYTKLDFICTMADAHTKRLKSLYFKKLSLEKEWQCRKHLLTQTIHRVHYLVTYSQAMVDALKLYALSIMDIAADKYIDEFEKGFFKRFTSHRAQIQERKNKESEFTGHLSPLCSFFEPYTNLNDSIPMHLLSLSRRLQALSEFVKESQTTTQQLVKDGDSMSQDDIWATEQQQQAWEVFVRAATVEDKTVDLWICHAEYQTAAAIEVDLYLRRARELKQLFQDAIQFQERTEVKMKTLFQNLLSERRQLFQIIQQALGRRKPATNDRTDVQTAIEYSVQLIEADSLKKAVSHRSSILSRSKVRQLNEREHFDYSMIHKHTPSMMI